MKWGYFYEFFRLEVKKRPLQNGGRFEAGPVSLMIIGRFEFFKAQNARIKK